MNMTQDICKSHLNCHVMQEKINKALHQLSEEARDLYLSSEIQTLDSSPTSLVFLRDYVSPNRPVIIKNCLKDWSACRKWTTEYLRKTLGDTQVTVTATPNGYADAPIGDRFVLPEEKIMLFKDFLRIWEENDTSNGVHYIQKQNSNFTDEFSVLVGDADSHVHWASEAFGTKPDAVNFWMGNSASVTSMHKDHYENIYAVVSGCKTFILHPPTDIHLIPYEDYKLAQYKENKETGNYDVVDIFEETEEHHEVNGTEIEQKTNLDEMSSLKENENDRLKEVQANKSSHKMISWIAVDPLNPDYHLYPQYQKCHKYIAKVEAGDILYLPSLWFHHVTQSDKTIAVNFCTRSHSKGRTATTAQTIHFNFDRDMTIHFWPKSGCKQIMDEEGIISNSVAFLGAIFLRWTIALNSYSGENKPPMYGDYEAQRHWMEITYNLPVKEWYTNSSRNDLMYWGLDYPPLTAYHSWICGYVANLLNPKWVELGTSRGFQSYDHKLFMRYTVVIADALVYISAVYAFVHTCLQNPATKKKGLLCGLILAYPGLILIDHGHFQYNCISLGLTLWAIVCLFHKKELFGAAFFSLALNYKQMELYHAFPFFFYLAGLCWKQSSWWKTIKKLLGIGFTVIGVFALCWLPFLGDLSSALQVLHRIFPVARGLYEDKVANFWCAISVVLKVKNILSSQRILQLCFATTLASCIPPCVNLFFRPTFRRFVLSLVNCSLAFFLFSFQVHEKSILIVALPICLLLPGWPLECVWFLLISCFSMYPLLERDGQATSYIALLILFLLLVSLIFDFRSYNKLFRYCFLLSLIGAVAIHLSAAILKPPSRLPDLFPVLFAVYSCGHFLLALLYFNYLQIRNSKPQDYYIFRD